MAELTLEEKIKRLVKDHSGEFKTQDQISSIDAKKGGQYLSHTAL